MPSLISLRSLRVAAPDGTPLVEDLTLTLGPQRYGLVGRNGGGKSTLLRVLAGEIAPAAGSAHVSGSVGWLRQETGPAEGTVARALGVAEGLARLARMLRGAGTAEDAATADWTLEERLAEALARVGLAGTDWHRPCDTLSGGQRTRLAVARVLIEAPEILLLDEPTNNLDTQGRAVVAGLVRDWRGCVVVASHDRDLLGGVDAIVEIGNGSARLFGGAWPDFAAARAARIRTAVATLDQAEREARRIARGAQAQRERQARRDSRGRADRARGDAPKTLFDARQDWAERTAGRGNRIAERKQAETAAALARARAEVEVLAPLRIAVPDAVRPGDRAVLVCEAVTVDAGGQRVLGPIDLTVTATDRIALTGPNGSGKSTLLRIAAGEIAPATGSASRAAGRVVLLDQHVAFLRDADRLIDAMRRMNPTLTNEDAHAALARFAFRNAAAGKPCQALSGGERMRAGLACVLSGGDAPALLLLDEPTNHMDIDSVEVLETALRGYRGALIVASHDRAFLAGVGVTTEFALASGGETGAPEGQGQG